MKKIFAVALLLSTTLSAFAQLGNNGFYRVRNVENNKDYLSLANDILNYTVIVDNAAGGFTNLAGTAGQNRAMECARLYMKTDIHVVEDDDCIDPATIMYIKKSSNKGQYDLIGQSTSLIKLTTGQVVHSTVTATFENIYAHIDKDSGSGANSQYTAYVTLSGHVKGYKEVFGIQIPIDQTQSLGDRYLVDNNKTFDIASNGNSTNAKWYIEPVTSFNVKADVEFAGKYYTTMYVPFAFTLSDNVLNAYIIKSIGSNGLLVTEIVATNGGTVPAGTPVLLECSSNVAAECKVIPVEEPRIDKETAYTGTNILSGSYFCNTDGIQTYNTESGTGTFNADNYISSTNQQKFVLGITTSGKLGFVKATGSAMPANKAWIEYTGSAELVLPFEKPIKWGDVNRDGEVDVNDITAMVNIILNKDNTQPYTYDHEAAELDDNNGITVGDLTVLVNIILNN